MSNRRTPVAARAPLGYAGGGDALTRLMRLQGEFSEVLKVPRVFVRHHGTEHFVSGKADDALFFHSQDERHSEPRYEWEDRGDGVLYGFEPNAGRTG